MIHSAGGACSGQGWSSCPPRALAVSCVTPQPRLALAVDSVDASAVLVQTHTHTHAHTRVCMRACPRACVLAHVCVRVRACVRARVCVV